jgi:hypothetical protein
MNVRLYDRGGMKSEAETYELKGHRHESALWSTRTREVASEANFSAEFESLDHVQVQVELAPNLHRNFIRRVPSRFTRRVLHTFFESLSEASPTPDAATDSPWG